MKVFVAALVLVSFACAFATPVQEINPLFTPATDVRILLQTRQNRVDAQEITYLNLASITNSHFNPDRPTRVLIHGWLSDDSSNINTATSAELLNYYDFNVILIDWSAGAGTLNYIAATNRVPLVGEFLAQQLDFMHLAGLLDYSRLTIVGFSLGAHVAGLAGKNTSRGRVNSIVGLDPAGPLFSSRNPEGRLDSGDADYVEAIHTNGQSLLSVGLGIGSQIGHADYWPNGGSSQSGCITNSCSHSRAVEFYVESIIDNSFFALGCSSSIISSLLCRVTPGEWMGGDGNNYVKTGRGSFYLETGWRSPFAQGPLRT